MIYCVRGMVAFGATEPGAVIAAGWRILNQISNTVPSEDQTGSLTVFAWPILGSVVHWSR